MLARERSIVAKRTDETLPSPARLRRLRQRLGGCWPRRCAPASSIHPHRASASPHQRLQTMVIVSPPLEDGQMAVRTNTSLKDGGCGVLFARIVCFPSPSLSLFFHSFFPASSSSTHSFLS